MEEYRDLRNRGHAQHIISNPRKVCFGTFEIKIEYGDFPGGSDGKASAYNAGDLGSIPGSGRSPGEGNSNPFQHCCHYSSLSTRFSASLHPHGSSAGKESACNAGDTSSIPGLGRCPGEGIGYPPQHSWASSKAPLWVKAQHEGALPPPCIVRNDPREKRKDIPF